MKKLKVAYASDLHCEFGDIELKNTENVDVLVLAGDTVLVNFLHEHPEPDVYPPEKDWGTKQGLAYQFRGFFARINKEFPRTIIILGNHEFYHGYWFKSIEHFRDEIKKYENITFLERESVEIGGVVFIGCTLWTDMNRGDVTTLYTIKSCMNDFRLIKNDQTNYSILKPEETTIRHRTSLDFISNTVKKCGDKKCVVVGHHSPSRLSTHQKYEADYDMNGGYSSFLNQFIYDHPQIEYWIHGHTHYPFDYMLGETNILCNPRGYDKVEESSKDFKLKYFEV